MSTEKNKKFGARDLEKRLGKLSVGEFLHTWRTTEEMTLKEFGALLGLSSANLCDIEKGRKCVSPEKAEKIAIAMGIPPELLIRLSIEESFRTMGLQYTVEIKSFSHAIPKKISRIGIHAASSKKHRKTTHTL